MRKLHIALSTARIDETVEDYSLRVGVRRCAYVPGEYALWRTDSLNLSVRKDLESGPGTLPHLGWEDASANGFTSQTDVNGIVWERFTAQEQADEINELWPGTSYRG